MDFAAELKSRLDIVNVIGEVVRLKRLGSSPRYVGLCPFHQEKTPSFNVHGSHQFFKCFGCGEGGDVYTFARKHYGLSFPETLEFLADRFGIPMPRQTHTDPDAPIRAAILKMHEIAASLYQKLLLSEAGEPARAYLAKRGISMELAATFGLGYSDPNGQLLVRKFQQDGFTAEQMEAAGLVRRREQGGFYDRFRGRLMFPIHSETGKVIAFGGRTMEAEVQPKYMNSDASLVYDKSATLYNLHRAKETIRKGNRVVLVEGYMDVIGVHAAGVPDVVASCGTALTPQQARILKRHTPMVVMNFDGDKAGAAATETKMPVLLDEGLKLLVLQLPGGLDPDEFVAAHGAEEYQRQLGMAGGYYHWLADRARSRFDLRTPEGKTEALRYLQPALNRIADRLERAAVAGDLASYLGVSPALVLEQFRRNAADRRAPAESPAPAATPLIRPVERVLLQAMLFSEEARAGVAADLRQLAILDELRTAKVLQAILSCHDAGETVDVATVRERLEPADQAVLEAVAFAEYGGGEEQAWLEQAHGCMFSLREESRRRMAEILRNKVREAERAGNLELALDLMKKLKEG